MGGGACRRASGGRWRGRCAPSTRTSGGKPRRGGRTSTGCATSTPRFTGPTWRPAQVAGSLALHTTIKPQAERYERLYLSLLVSDLQTSAAEHEAIAAAIERGNADAAQRAVQTNWRNAAERLGRVIDRAGERGSW